MAVMNISAMQVASFCSRGISAAHITAESSRDVKEGVQKGEYQLVYITPELLINGATWRKMLVGVVYTERLKSFVVDEAHTVKKWYISTLNSLIHSSINCVMFPYSTQGSEFSSCDG